MTDSQAESRVYETLLFEQTADGAKTETPFYITDEARLTKNLEILRDVSVRAGCKILLAQKAFSMYALYPLIGRYLHGTAASGPYEARLGYEEMCGEVHVFSPAYDEKYFGEICKYCTHIIFNSFSQWKKYKDSALAAGASCGLRINPEHSTGSHAVYDPCAPGSRLGVTEKNFTPELLEGIEGLHFHTLCEQNADALAETLDAAEKKFGRHMRGMKWINMGGGHHITRDDYDTGLLIDCVKRVKKSYGLEVYLEPGEAVVLNAGFFVASVLDVVENEMSVAILDASAACHMPDVLEMPYRPVITGAGGPGEKKYTYRLAGPTCLAGDVIGDYSFDAPLEAGVKIIFNDMAHYTMVKNNTFNGTPLPASLIKRAGGKIETVKQFGYEDFKRRV